MSTSTPNQGATVVPNSLMPRRNWRNSVSASRKNQAAFGWFSGPGCVAPCGIERGKSQKISSLNPIPLRLFFARSELRRPRDVSPLILRKAHNQGIDILRSPKTNLIFDRWQNIISDNQHRPLMWSRQLEESCVAVSHGVRTVVDCLPAPRDSSQPPMGVDANCRNTGFVRMTLCHCEKKSDT